MTYASKTNIGSRLRNEDACRLPEAEDACPLVVVSDGMGGHAAGAYASALVVEGLLGELPSLAFADNPARALEKAIQRVNLDICRRAGGDESLSGMGATLVCALPGEESFIAACVGDSRLYHFGGGELTQVTSDHSFVEMLVESGRISREEAQTHPQRHLITRAMGLSPHVEADVFERAWAAGDRLLLCSDGLHGAVSDGEIRGVLMEELSIESQCDRLIALALSAGGSDNITVAIVQNGEAELC